MASVHKTQMIASENKILPYQSLPVKHLLARCPTQHGALIWHGLGTGKTGSGLAFIGSLKKSKVVLLVPAALVDVWFAEARKFGVDLKKLQAQQRLRVMTIESLRDGKPAFPWNGKASGACLVCDEAHNLAITLQDLPRLKAEVLYDWLLSFRKVILLSGTPIYRQDSDFRLLVNIAAGRSVFPLNEAEFERMFFKTNRFRSAFYGWFLTFLDKLFFQARDVAVGAFEYQTIKSGQTNFTVRYTLQFFKQFLHSTAAAAAVTVALPLVFVFSLKALINIVIRSQIHKIRSLDETLVAKTAQRYVSYYEVPSMTHNSDYPSVMRYDSPVEYNAYQVDVWIRFALGHLTMTEVQRLGLATTPTLASLFAGVTTEDVYKSVGRAIGNLEFWEQGKEIPPPKFDRIFSMLKKPDGGTRQTVVYSSFWKEGTLKFSTYLTKRKVSHEVLDPRSSAQRKERTLAKFAQRHCNLLLLHPDFNEGISIKGAERLHILEPIATQATLQQVVARVKRMHSHAHLLPHERHVDVLIWHCQATRITDSIMKWGIQQREWWKYDSHVGPWADRKGFRTDITPDSLTLLQAETISSTIVALQKAFTKTSMATLAISRQRAPCSTALDDDPTPRPVCKLF